MSASEAIQLILDSLPTKPGVYLQRDANGKILYVGKAINLRSRVRSYFTESAQEDPKVRRLVAEVADIDFIVTDSELEALILEATLIKQHRPRFNVRLKDDKRYPYIKVTLADPYPRVVITRQMERDGSRYFGPFTSSSAVRETMALLRRLFPSLTCNRDITGKDERPCLYYDIRLCLGPCIDAVDQAGYRAMIDELVRFLEGRSDEVITSLERRMRAAAEALNFELAARLRDQLKAIQHVVAHQKVVSEAGIDRDVLAIARANGDACVEVFFIRDGKLLGQEYFVLEGTEGENEQEALAAFITQFYEEAAYVPPEVLLPARPQEALIIEEWLRSKRGDRVALSVPQNGPKQELVRMAAENAAATLESLRARWAADKHKQEDALQELQDALDLPALPARIECYDISTTQGTETVGSMVVFELGVPRKAHYRRFNVRGVQGQDDFASMREVLTRRFRRWQTATSGELRGVRDTKSWAMLPDLLIVDGGKGQLGVAVDVLREFELLERVPVVGLAKQREEIFVPGRPDSILLPRRSEALYLVQRVRDEAHRFAITHHRERRSKATVSSQLDAVPGVGPVRRRRLLTHFKSVDAIRQAGVDEIAAVPGIPREVAEAIKEQLG